MKYLKNSIYSILIAGTLLLGSGFSVDATAQGTPNFDTLKSEFENDRVFIAEFSHHYEDSFTGETQNMDGKIWIGREQYKVEGENQVMVVDGDISRVHDGSKNRVIVSDYVEEEDDFAPSRMLQGVDESYSVEEMTEDDGTTVITLTSDDPFSIFATVTIRLAENGLPTEIAAVDQADNIITTSFSGGRFSDYSEDQFMMDIPEGTEEIDLRHDS